MGWKSVWAEVISANMGSFDFVRLAPHFAQDDSGSYNGGSYNGSSYNSSSYNRGSYNGSSYNGSSYNRVL